MIWKLVIGGILLGLTTLFQFQQTLWIPVLLIAWMCFLIFKIIRKEKLGSFFEGSLLFVIGLLIVAGPWWMRNTKAIGAPIPIGYAVHSNLVGAYSPAAMETDGDLNIEEILKQRLEVVEPLLMTEMTLAEKEEQFAKHSWSEATTWIEDNPSDVQTLMASRIRNHLGLGKQSFDDDFPTTIHRWLAILGILGCSLCWKPMGRFVFPVLIASVLVTALTWSDEGRLFIPLRPLLYATFAGGVARIVRLSTTISQTNSTTKH